MTNEIVPYYLKDAPALMECLLPVQKLSAEVYKERMAGTAQTLTALGNYWKGRKPLILNKACILGCLLPATDDLARDLEIFEKLMAMDDESFTVRWRRRFSPKEILAKVSISNIREFFEIEPDQALPRAAPVDWSEGNYGKMDIAWRRDLSIRDRRRLEAQMLPMVPFRERVESAQRPEEVADRVHDHIWESVNSHLGTDAKTFPELVEQLGVMRYGRRPRFADPFCGSGQIPFEAARLGCDSYASDFNPMAAMLTWGAFNIVGGPDASRRILEKDLQELIQSVQSEIDSLGVETDGKGWRARNYIYCLEARCPQSGWMVPLIPSLVLSEDYGILVELVPNLELKRYDIHLRHGATAAEMKLADHGTVRSEGRGQEPYMFHTVTGIEYRTKISTLRGDFRKEDGSTGNALRFWEKRDFMPRAEDIFQESLYAVLWMRPSKTGGRDEYEFRPATAEDLSREAVVEGYIQEHIEEWQEQGWLPDMRIEPGEKTDEPIRTRGWTHWHHLFNPRQLLLGGLLRKHLTGSLTFGFCQVLNYNSRLSIWLGRKSRGYGNTVQTFNNQALNTLFNYGCRGSSGLVGFLDGSYKDFPLADNILLEIQSEPAVDLNVLNDLYITDPPYGDAVKYEEIMEFFIAWLRKNPPPEFADWVWDSRRALAIKGEGEGFRSGMVAAYTRMTECMPDNGIQVIMFTHQSGSIWADMANIVWASGLQVTAAWYVVTETDSALREGSYVKGTVLLVCRKRKGTEKTTRGDLAWEIQEEVEKQVQDLTGLNQQAKGLYRDENVFEDADIQMAGYAAALRALTRYAFIDGRDMTLEATRPRVKGETTFVDELIAFAVDTANQYLVPQGIPKPHWDRLSGAERFYLKMVDMEARGAKSLDNYQNFAKAFKVGDFRTFLASQKANSACLKSARELGRSEMGEASELYQSVLRAVLYAVMELQDELDGSEVLAHLMLNIPNYYGDLTQRDLALSLADYLAKRLADLRPEEATCARILHELIKTQPLG